MAFAAEYQRILSRPTARPVSVSTNSSQILCSHFGDDQYEVFKEDCIPPSKTSGRTKKAHAFAQVKYVALCPSEDFGLTQERKENLNIFELRVLRVLVVRSEFSCRTSFRKPRKFSTTVVRRFNPGFNHFFCFSAFASASSRIASTGFISVHSTWPSRSR